MTRPLRLEFSGAFYHVTSRGDDRKKIYFEEADFELFLTTLSDVCEQYNWIIHAYCLMTNHYHLLIETPDANLSKGMRQLNGVFTQAINRKHGRVGHLFQGRYKSILVDKDAYLLELCRYIVLNPVRARMVESPEQWDWSSWHSMVGNVAPPIWLATDSVLSLFDRNRVRAIKEYIEFVANGEGVSIWDNLQQQVFLGGDDFIEKYQGLQLALPGNLREIPLKQRSKPPLPLAQYQQQSSSRDEAIFLAYKSGGYTLRQIGDHFKLHYSRVSRIVAKGKI
ncbi:MAG: transposase [Alteromonadales bacterium]|nr:transposase [Alteromonadales bacterium]